MTITEVRIYTNTIKKRKENMSDFENLYLRLRNYNHNCCNIDINYQKLKYDYNTYKEKRKDNYDKFIDKETLNLMKKIKYPLKLVMEKTEWDFHNLTLEEVLYRNYEMAIENIKKDMKLVGGYNV